MQRGGLEQVDQMVLKRGDHAVAVEGFTQQQGTAIAGGALSVELNADGPLQEGARWMRFHPWRVVLLNRVLLVTS